MKVICRQSLTCLLQTKSKYILCGTRIFEIRDDKNNKIKNSKNIYLPLALNCHMAIFNVQETLHTDNVVMTSCGVDVWNNFPRWSCWSLNHFQWVNVIVRTRILELVYIRWLWHGQQRVEIPPACPLKYLPLFTFRVGTAGSWHEPNKFGAWWLLS